MTFFAQPEAAKRYARYRPKVHSVIASWLLDAGTPATFDRALDIACGTGDSCQPLTEFCQEVIGIDQSDAMLAKAREKSLTVYPLPYQQAHTLGAFDLITTCMAFHWFDRAEAIASYKKASRPGACWLIYNFSFGGSATDEVFNHWFTTDYLQQYPTPPRQAPLSGVINDPEVELLSKEQGQLPLTLSQVELIGYLTTQSNIEAQVQNGQDYETIEALLNRQLSELALNNHYLYNFQYEIYRYNTL